MRFVAVIWSTPAGAKKSRTRQKAFFFVCSWGEKKEKRERGDVRGTCPLLMCTGAEPGVGVSLWLRLCGGRRGTMAGSPKSRWPQLAPGLPQHHDQPCLRPFRRSSEREAAGTSSGYPALLAAPCLLLLTLPCLLLQHRKLIRVLVTCPRLP